MTHSKHDHKFKNNQQTPCCLYTAVMADWLTSFSMQNIVERTEWHQLADNDQIRRLIASTEHRQHVRVIEYPATVRHCIALQS